MKFKHAFKMFTGILMLFLLYGAVGGIDPSSAVAHAADNPDISKTRGWTCPMHAEVHKHGPGRCPICKMNLVKVKARNIEADKRI